MTGAGDANGSKPLKGMKFVLIGKTEKPREEVAREITEMGGKVVTKVDKKTAACISSKGILISNVVKKGMFLYSAVSSPLDCSKRFTLHPLADLFIPAPTRLLRAAF